MRRSDIALILLVVAVPACSKSPRTPPGAPGTGPRPPQTSSPTKQAVGIGVLRPLALPNPAVPGPAVGGFTDASAGGLQATRDGNHPEYSVHFARIQNEAMRLLREKKLSDALGKFYELRALHNSDQLISLMVESLARRIETETNAQQTAINVQAILESGRTEKAARLAGDALRQYCNSDAVKDLVAVKRQADSLQITGLADRKARFEYFRKEYESAVFDGNKRAALLALEHALLNGDNADLSRRRRELRSELGKYDALREQANDASADRTRIDEANASLQEAQKIWDNPAIRDDIEQFRIEAQMIGLNARDRLIVADFLVAGDIGMPSAGAAIADRLSPAFATRYEIVDRAQVGKLAQDLELSPEALLVDPIARRELGRAAKAQYIVVGSVTPVDRFTVQARLIDVQTGLVVQTARLVADRPEQVVDNLPRLAADLQMSDAQRQSAEEQQANEAVPVKVAEPAGDLKLPPLPERLGDVPPPVIPARPQSPAAYFAPEQLDQFVPMPADGISQLPAISEARDQVLRRRAFYAAIELGDNLFRRGMYRAALLRFEFARCLFPEVRDVRLRIERCLPLAPPEPRRRPGLAILDFRVVGQSQVAPTYLSWWIRENLAPYLGRDYSEIDRAELLWWMGRLGVTPAELVRDHSARIYLARAVDARYFLFGSAVGNENLSLTGYLVEAATGFLVSGARIHVRDAAELRNRLDELAWLTTLTPGERRRVEEHSAQWALLLNDIRQSLRQQVQLAECVKLCEMALRLRPGNIEVLEILQAINQSQMQAVVSRYADPSSEWVRTQMRAKEERMALARVAEQARLEAEAAAKKRSDAERRKLNSQRKTAAEHLLAEATELTRVARYDAAITWLETAAALQPNEDAIVRKLAHAIAKREEAQKDRVAEARAAGQTDARRRREQEIGRIRTELENEQKQRQGADRAARAIRDEQDQRDSDRLLALAQQLAANKRYDHAVTAAHLADRIRSTPESHQLLNELLVASARANAEAKGESAKAKFERELAAGEAARIAAEKKATESQQLYEQAIAEGRQFLNQEKFAQADEQFLTAKKIRRTDAVLTALKQVQSAKKQAQTLQKAKLRAEAESARRTDELRQRLADAQAALAAKQYEKAVQQFHEARTLDPSNVDLLTGLIKSEQLLNLQIANARRRNDERVKLETFQRLLRNGKANLSARRYESAAFALGEALKLVPDDADARSAWADANSKLAADAQSEAERQNRSARYQALMSDGRRYMAAKQYDNAAWAFHEVQSLMKVDKAAEEFAQEALRLKAEAENQKVEDRPDVKAARKPTS